MTLYNADPPRRRAHVELCWCSDAVGDHDDLYCRACLGRNLERGYPIVEPRHLFRPVRELRSLPWSTGRRLS